MVGDLAAAVLAAPVLAALAGSGWEGFWTGRHDGPLGPGARRTLGVTQVGLVVLLVVPAADRWAAAAAGLFYLVLAAGVLVLRSRLGSVPCGCWGVGGSRLSVRLAAADAALGMFGLLVAVAGPDRALALSAAAAAAAALTIVTFIVVVGVPELRHALAGMRTRVEQERRWFLGFPELEQP